MNKHVEKLVKVLEAKIEAGAKILHPGDFAPVSRRIPRTDYRGRVIGKRSKIVTRDTGLAQEALHVLEHRGLVYRWRDAEHGGNSSVGEGIDEVWIVRNPKYNGT